MMILSKLTLQNFKSYRAFTIEFQEGFLGIVGKNGSGKSTLFEAILFALYGELKSRGTKELIRNTSVTTKDIVSIELLFEIENSSYRVVREFRGKRLTPTAKLYKNETLIATGAKEVTLSITQRTKLSKNAFLHTLFASQKELTNLSGLRSEERKQMIRKLLGLEKIDFIEKAVVTHLRESKKEIEILRNILMSDSTKALKEQQLKEKKEQKEHLQQSIHEEEKQLQKLQKEQESQKKTIAITQQEREEQLKYKEHKLQYDGLQRELIELREHYAKAKSDIKRLEAECTPYPILHETLQENKSRLEEANFFLQKEQKEEQKLLTHIAIAKQQIESTNEKIQNIENLGNNSPCPICTRPLLEEYEKVLDSLVKLIEQNYTKEILLLEERLQTIQQKIEKLLQNKKYQENTLQETSKELHLLESKQKDLEEAKHYFVKVKKRGLANKSALENLQPHDYKEERLQKIDKKLHLQQTAYTQLLQTKEKEIAKINALKVEIAQIQGEIKTLQTILLNENKQYKRLKQKEESRRDYEKIKESLSSFKNRLNTQIAPRISTIASQMYAQITKGKYQHIEVDNEFNFFIYDDGRKYPLERFSGGEIDLANLVLRIALSRVVIEINGASSVEFLAFDELFGSQDENRRREILKAFYTIKEQYKQIFLISHEMDIKEMFEQIIAL